MRDALARNDKEVAFAAFAADALAWSSDEIDAMRRLSTWTALVGHAALILRELESVESLIGRPELFHQCAAPTLFLVGGDSPPRYRTTAEALSAVLPLSRVVILPDQGHVAINTAPELFADTVIDFLTARVV